MTLDEFVKQISAYSCETYFEQYPEIDMTLENLGNTLRDMPCEMREQALDSLEEMVETAPAWMKIHVLSFCMAEKQTPCIAEKLLDTVFAADFDEVGEYNKLSHYWQITRAVFTDGALRSPEVEIGLTRLYRLLFDTFAAAVGVAQCQYIPKAERDENLVFVFAAQVLEQGHAPTLTLLDRCYILKTVFHKRVFIINTAMYMTEKGRAPFYNMQDGMYVPELSESAFLEFKGERFRYYQCPKNMPDIQVITELVELIRAKRPGYILDIGGSDICADICGRIVPEITVSTVFSGIATSCGEWQMIDKQVLSQTDRERLGLLGVCRDNVRRVPFTFSFKAQQHCYTRQQLGLPEEKFLLVIVGWRLDEEVSYDFLEMLATVTQREPKVGIVFIGRFRRFENCLGEHPRLRQCAYSLGEQQDVLAVLECVDLYVNPKRQGGGSSVAEALSKGLPAVTLPVGDVSVAAGEAFCVNDYPSMETQILSYAGNRSLYEKMSEKAKERAMVLMDSKAGFGKALCEIEELLE